MTDNRKPNKLIHEKSPYLLQHTYNPVDWYPWGEEAFDKAKKEDKPVFLSIGYSTCHWCHVMAHESFEDSEVAEILNEHFVAIKVDKEERPDIDGVYMAVCQAFTGSGGWPMSIFMTPEQKPFFAGTYFPKHSGRGMPGFTELLEAISEKWESDKSVLLSSAEEIISSLKQKAPKGGRIDENLPETAVSLFRQSFDKVNGGFGNAPKFPTPHNLLFLMDYYKSEGSTECLHMAEKTLTQMYRGGIFDHIGYGFSRYSTDRYFLVPHFEKMLYDNALLMMSYTEAFRITGKQIYRDAAEKTAEYILREMTSPEGAFYCAQDADSDGVEGKYYVFERDEIINLLGRQTGEEFCSYYGINEKGNFEGKSIPNLLKNDNIDGRFESNLPKIREYRKSRAGLHLDDKILTSWNSLMIAAFSRMSDVFGEDKYLDAAVRAEAFIREKLSAGEGLFVSFRDGVRTGMGFLDDYAYYAFALLCLSKATGEEDFLTRAQAVCGKAVRDFKDEKDGGFYLSGRENDELIFRPKETYDGALPSGNSVMAYNLVLLSALTNDIKTREEASRQMEFMSAEAGVYPAGHAFFLLALSLDKNPPDVIVVVLKDEKEKDEIKSGLNRDAYVRFLNAPTEEYGFINGMTTFYVCGNGICRPPTNTLPQI